MTWVRARYLGPLVLQEELIWQDRVDVIVLGGCAAVAAAAMGAGHEVTVPFTPLEPTIDGFRNYVTIGNETVLEGRDRKSGEIKWTGTVADLVFGSNSQLRSLAEAHAASDSPQ